MVESSQVHFEGGLLFEVKTSSKLPKIENYMRLNAVWFFLECELIFWVL